MSSPDEVIAIGHRGAPRQARENTLESLEAALELGADWVEVDAKVTKDGEVIVVHDDTLERLWCHDLVVRDCLWDDIRRELSTEPHGIPTLTEAIDLVAGRGAVLLVDIADELVADACCALDIVRGHPEAVAFTGDPEGLAVVRRLLPEVTISLSWEQLALPAADVFARVRPEYFNQVSTLLDGEVVGYLHARGMLVSAYTVDDEGEISHLVDCGVDAIISNDIALLREVLDADRQGGRDS